MKKLFYLLLSVFSFFISCNDDDVPSEENPEELINRVGLIFSNEEGAPISVEAIDADGEGPGSIEPTSVITLSANTAYELFLSFENTINEIDITEEIKEEAEEHQVFFSFSEALFSSPEGMGNGPGNFGSINYLDKDSTNLPLGLITGWITDAGNSTGTFTVILKHQPGIKSMNSTVNDGVTDVSVTFSLEVE